MPISAHGSGLRIGRKPGSTDPGTSIVMWTTSAGDKLSKSRPLVLAAPRLRHPRSALVMSFISRAFHGRPRDQGQRAACRPASIW